MIIFSIKPGDVGVDFYHILYHTSGMNSGTWVCFYSYQRKMKKMYGSSCVSQRFLSQIDLRDKIPLTKQFFFKTNKQKNGEPGWLSRLGIWLRLRSWSHGWWVQAPHQALCWQLRARSLFQILCLPLSLWHFPTRTLSLCLLKINKYSTTTT